MFIKNGDFDEYKLKKGTKNRPGTSAAETGWNYCTSWATATFLLSLESVRAQEALWERGELDNMSISLKECLFGKLSGIYHMIPEPRSEKGEDRFDSLGKVCTWSARPQKKTIKKRESNNPLFITVNTFTRPDTASKFSSMQKAVAGCVIGEHFSLLFVNLFRQTERESLLLLHLPLKSVTHCLLCTCQDDWIQSLIYADNFSRCSAKHNKQRSETRSQN